MGAGRLNLKIGKRLKKEAKKHKITNCSFIWLKLEVILVTFSFE
jgi:hypothetical protein